MNYVELSLAKEDSDSMQRVAVYPATIESTKRGTERNSRDYARKRNRTSNHLTLGGWSWSANAFASLKTLAIPTHT